MFFSVAVLALLVIKQVRFTCQGVGATKVVAWLEFMSWVSMLGATVLFCSSLMRAPELKCAARRAKGETCAFF
jgi:hypothetical protein